MLQSLLWGGVKSWDDNAKVASGQWTELRWQCRGSLEYHDSVEYHMSSSLVEGLQRGSTQHQSCDPSVGVDTKVFRTAFFLSTRDVPAQILDFSKPGQCTVSGVQKGQESSGYLTSYWQLWEEGWISDLLRYLEVVASLDTIAAFTWLLQIHTTLPSPSPP